MLETLGLRTEGRARPAGAPRPRPHASTRCGSRSATSASACRSSLPEELNAYDVLVNDWIVFSTATLDAAIAALLERAATTDGVDDAADAGDDR